MTPKEEIEQFMRGEWTRGGFNRIFSYTEWPGKKALLRSTGGPRRTSPRGNRRDPRGRERSQRCSIMQWAGRTTTVLQDDESFATADLQIQSRRAAKTGFWRRGDPSSAGHALSPSANLRRTMATLN